MPQPNRETKENSGVLFRNEDKQTESHPDYKGRAKVNGVDMWLSAWVNTAQSGIAYMSLSFTAKEHPNGGPRGQGSAVLDVLKPTPASGSKPRTQAPEPLARSLAPSAPKRSTSGGLAPAKPDPDLDAEPDDIPF